MCSDVLPDLVGPLPPGQSKHNCYQVMGWATEIKAKHYTYTKCNQGSIGIVSRDFLYSVWI